VIGSYTTAREKNGGGETLLQKEGKENAFDAMPAKRRLASTCYREEGGTSFSISPETLNANEEIKRGALQLL